MIKKHANESVSRQQQSKKMIPSLMKMSVRVLGKYFLAMESLRYIPNEIVQMIFDEYLKTIENLSILNENDLGRLVNLLTDYHGDVFCSSLCYSKSNLLNFLPSTFYFNLIQRVQNHLVQLDFSNVFENFDRQEKNKFLNVIGQMETIEYLRLTHNRFDDDDIRILTARNRIRSQSLCNLRELHLQGNHLTSRSARFLKALTSLETLYVSHLSSYEKTSFINEFDNLSQCTCTTNYFGEEIINIGWISQIPQFQSSSKSNDDQQHFYRKRRRIDHDESISLVKLVRFCNVCRPVDLPLPSTKVSTKKNESNEQTKGFIDRQQLDDLLSSYL